MATITTIKNAKGITYRAQIRKFKDGELIYSEAKTFDKRSQAQAWAALRESQLDPAEISLSKSKVVTVGDLIAKYESHYCSKESRSKTAAVRALQETDIARLPLNKLTSEALVAHARERLLTVKPQTVLNDFIWLSQVYESAYPTWGIHVDRRELDAAIALCRSKGMIHKPDQRDRRPSDAEIKKLSEYFKDRDSRSDIPMHDIMHFAIHSARRQAEITRLRWDDNDTKHQTGLVRDLKHPRKKMGNHRRFKYTAEAWAIVERQPKISEFIFPYESKSIGAAFTKACHLLGIKDLHFHDLRREAVSRLFEAGYSIPEVVQFSLHSDWQMLRRYTELAPENLVLR